MLSLSRTVFLQHLPHYPAGMAISTELAEYSGDQFPQDGKLEAVWDSTDLE
jgi:hypothetical protein